jgi:hypothetical protein
LPNKAADDMILKAEIITVNLKEEEKSGGFPPRWRLCDV